MLPGYPLKDTVPMGKWYQKINQKHYFQENGEATDDVSVPSDSYVSITSTSSARAAS